MIEGRCPSCGQLYYGLALLQPENQSCDRCGTELVITRGKKRAESYSLFSARVYRLPEAGDADRDPITWNN